jgi:hypothetical protein
MCLILIWIFDYIFHNAFYLLTHLFFFIIYQSLIFSEFPKVFFLLRYYYYYFLPLSTLKHFCHHNINLSILKFDMNWLFFSPRTFDWDWMEISAWTSEKFRSSYVCPIYRLVSTYTNLFDVASFASLWRRDIYIYIVFLLFLHERHREEYFLLG